MDQRRIYNEGRIRTDINNKTYIYCGRKREGTGDPANEKENLAVEISADDKSHIERQLVYNALNRIINVSQKNRGAIELNDINKL